MEQAGAVQGGMIGILLCGAVLLFVIRAARMRIQRQRVLERLGVKPFDARKLSKRKQSYDLARFHPQSIHVQILGTEKENQKVIAYAVKAGFSYSPADLISIAIPHELRKRICSGESDVDLSRCEYLRRPR